ncbi:uncharacterized protein LOC121758291 [Salvia splendens]|uniref:uncharacterized protein LOC121758291 n=1 Tax=Salvia splendens TaxID=180675 RepID=UPI0011027EEB|nr:uncharacterized protein LOC121758291 [Salvia splendens]
MERTPAACAMDWSIQLQKDLRSDIPGKPIDALEEIGRRLQRWNKEPKLTIAEHTMFGLIPEEDKLFLNAILLCLADAFSSGDKQTKKCVVRIFMKIKRRGNRDAEGIFSKEMFENQLELLSRVKEVFDEGDTEERALSLRLFGCWAYLAKDCPDVRYIVLSSLVTGDVLEVKAAYFAAGCLSEMSDDFAIVFLEMLRTTVSSQDSSEDIKLAAGRAFAKLWCSFSIAENAYKLGLKLLMDSLGDDFSATMLISLSKIASRWMLLIPTQIELLTLFQSEDRSLRMQVTSLRCFCFLLAREVCMFPSNTSTVHRVFGILHRSELQPTLQLESLRLLYKILLINLPIIPCMEIPELFQKLFVVVKNMLNSSVQSNRVFAVNVLADLSGKVLGRQDMWSGGSGCTLASQVISFILDQVISLVTPLIGNNMADFAVEFEVKSLLKTLFNLIENCPKLHCLVLNSACLFVCNLMKMIDRKRGSEKTVLSNPHMTVYVSNGKTLVESNIILTMSKIMAFCLENLEYTNTETSHTLDLDALKLQVEIVCRCSYIGSYTRLMNFLLLHLHSAFICMKNLTEDLLSPCKSSSLSCASAILEFDKSTLGCANEILEGNNYWYAYKAGKNAACQGAWSTAAFIFEQLMKAVKSPSCCSWLKSLSWFSTSEKTIQLFFLSGQGTSIIPGGSGLREMGVSALRTQSYKYREILLNGRDEILSAEEILRAPDMGHIFSFQRWFLTLRAKVLKKVADMMQLLDSVSFIQGGTGCGGVLDRGTLLLPTTSLKLGSFINSLMEASCHMKKLAEESDMLLTSFMGMDRQSVMSVSTLALNCSAMAFTAGFAFLVPDWCSSEIYKVSESRYLDETLHALLIEDLLGRFKHIGRKTRENLLFLLKPFRNCNRCSSSRFITQTCSYETVILHKLCEYSVREIFNLFNEASRRERDADALHQIISRASEVLRNVISNLMLVPFHTPHHFFKVRSAVSTELFVMNEDGQVLDGSSILLGSSLSLNLSFQMKNMTTGLPSPSNKVYCILGCKPHLVTTNIRDSKWQSQLRKEEDEMDDTMELNKKLFRYVTGSVETEGHCRRRDNDRFMVTEYVRFELNERGQGFSTCFLDISILPVGAYKIIWHSGYVDSEGSYRSLLPVNAGPSIIVKVVTTV